MSEQSTNTSGEAKAAVQPTGTKSRRGIPGLGRNIGLIVALVVLVVVG